MDKPTRLIEQNKSETAEQPSQQPDPSPTLTYRIICNSEHFLVINPSRKPKEKAEGERKKEADPRKKFIKS